MFCVFCLFYFEFDVILKYFLYHLSNYCLKSDSHLPKKFLFICLNKSSLKRMKNPFYFILKALNGIKVRVFFGKNIEKKYFCHHDKDYYYFCKSNICVINLIVGSLNMIKVSKSMSL